MRTEQEIQERLESPDNLCNFLNRPKPSVPQSPVTQGEEKDAEVINPNPGLKELDPPFVPTNPIGSSIEESETGCVAAGKSTEDPVLVNPVVLEKMYNGGRRPGDDNLDPTTRVLVASLAQMDTVRNVAEAFEISPSQVNNLKEGMTTPKNGKNAELQAVVQSTREKVNHRVLDKLLKTTDAILDEELIEAPLRVKLDAIKTLASVAEKTMDKEAPDSRKFVVFVPIEREMNHYPSKDAPIKSGG